mgnify:CR=1 FL=1
MERIKGIAAAPGLASGKLHLVGEVELTIPEHKSTDPEAEISRLVAARAKAAKDLAALKEQVLKGKAASEAEIFEAHLMILEDESILSEAETAIRAGENAEKAWMDASEMIAGMLEQLDDATLSARAADIRDVGRRVLAALLGVERTKTRKIIRVKIGISKCHLPLSTSFSEGIFSLIRNPPCLAALKSTTIKAAT